MGRIARLARVGTLLVLAVFGPATFGQGGMGGPGMSGPGMSGPGMPMQGPKKKREPIYDKVSHVNKGFDSFTIAAVVDDRVILLEDIVASIRPELEARKRQLPPAQFKEFERERIKAAVQNKIQQVIVLNELRKKLPDKAIFEKIRTAAEGDFEKYMNRIAHQNNLKSREELIAQLNKEGTDLQAIKNNFIDNMLAQQFLNSLVQPKITEPTRDEMEVFYQEHIDKWSQTAGVVWRQIEIKRGGDPAAARAKIEALRAELLQGADFAEVAKKNSQGPTAAAGGLWSRTSKGSYADKLVDEAIFSVPVGQVSDVIDGKTSFHLVRVEERSDGSPKAFVDVQEQCREGLRIEQITKLRKELVMKFKESHHIVSVFDEPQAAQLAQPDSRDATR